MVLCDFHIHSNYSDGHLPLAKVVDFYGQRKFGAIAITDHLCEAKTFLGKSAQYLQKSLNSSFFSTYIEHIEFEARRAWSEYKMVVIPGIEITKNSFRHDNSAHILCLNIKKYIDPDLSVEEICQRTREQGGIAVAAHPVPTGRLEHQTYYLWKNKDRLVGYFDAWEVASGPILFDQVYRSGLPMLATGDFHRPQHIQSWKTLVNSEPQPLPIMEAIKKQDLSFYFYKEKKHEQLSRARFNPVKEFAKLFEPSPALP